MAEHSSCYSAIFPVILRGEQGRQEVLLHLRQNTFQSFIHIIYSYVIHKCGIQFDVSVYCTILRKIWQERVHITSFCPRASPLVIKGKSR